MSIITKQSIINFCLPALLALVLTGCMQVAGDREVPPASQIANGFTGDELPPPPPAHSKTLRFWRDYSKSIDEETLAKIAHEVADAIMRHKEQIVGLDVVRFSNSTNSVWTEMPVKFIWGPAPEIPEFKPDLDKAPPDAKLFKDAMTKYIERERRKFDEKNALLLSEYKARVEEQLKKFMDHLLQGPSVPAPCTHFTTLAERMKTEDLPYSVLITDGWADCPNEKGHATDGVALHGKHVIIQLTRHMDSQMDEKEFLQRKAYLQELFPASEVMPASMPDQAIEFIFR